MNCPECKHSVYEDARFCSECGTTLQIAEEAVLTCSKCEKELAPDAKFCAACGAAVQESSAKRSRWSIRRTDGHYQVRLAGRDVVEVPKEAVNGAAKAVGVAAPIVFGMITDGGKSKTKRTTTRKTAPKTTPK